MGLDRSGVVFLCAAKNGGVDFTRMATIGRQSLFASDAIQLTFDILGIKENGKEFQKRHDFSEEFLALLGANTLESLDYSDYEGATITHDMNQPLPRELYERFSVVYDGGSLEHIFNAPQAFKNCMEMVEVGGHFVQVTNANNFMGHGLWQFSPDIIFRMFSEENGYKIRAVFLHEVSKRGGWYKVTDPAVFGNRVELINNEPTYIATIAQRIEPANIFGTPPQQSDYAATWESHSAGPAPSTYVPKSPNHPVEVIKRLSGWSSLTPQKKQQVHKLIHDVRTMSFLHQGLKQRCYTRVSEADLMRGKF